MNKAYIKDILRMISKNRKRFISIVVITLLGVTMLTGLKASCDDLRMSADKFFDEQNLYDIKVLSTLGLTDEDIDVLKDVDGIKEVEGIYYETLYLDTEEGKHTIDFMTLSQKGINMPYVVEGRLPASKDEVAVTEKYLNAANKKIGDSVVISDKDSKVYNREFTITGIILEVTNISADDGAASFRSTSTTDSYFYVTSDAFDYDIYTTVYLTLDNTKEMLCYSDEYDEAVKEVVEYLEDHIKTQREKARYTSVIDEAMSEYEDAKEEMEEEFSKAQKKIDDAQKEITDGFKKINEAYQEIKDNEDLLEENQALLITSMKDAYAKIEDGFKQLDEAQEELDSYYLQIEDGYQQLEDAKEELDTNKQLVIESFDDSLSALDDSISTLETNKTVIEENLLSMKQQFNISDEAYNNLLQALYNAYLPLSSYDVQISFLQQQLQLDPENSELLASLEQLQTEKSQYESSIETLYVNEKQALLEEMVYVPSEYQNTFIDLMINHAKVCTSIDVLNASKEETLQLKEDTLKTIEDGYLEIANHKAMLDSQKAQLDEGQKEIDDNYALLNDNLSLLKEEEDKAYKQIQDGLLAIKEGKEELEKNKQKLIDGQKELDDNKAEFEDKKEEAYEELAKAKKEIDDIDMTKWYIQDRNSLGGYTSIESDAASIETVGNAFPVVFLTIAILISLTTMTRLIEEERGLIGTYKGLGFSDFVINLKYMIYSILACLIGGLLGDICGYILVPEFVFSIFAILYKLPQYYLGFNVLYGIGGIVLFVVAVTLAALSACYKELKQVPAVLMRPKVPASGSRVILEYIKPLWKRLSFLNKVTARNLFRYKKRMFMTIGGIAGCTALLLCGFAIKDSVSELLPGQYERVYRYDYMAVVSDDYEEFEQQFKDDERIEEFMSLRIDSIKVRVDNKEESVQLMVIEDKAVFDHYIGLTDCNDNEVKLDQGIYITENASVVLDFDEGDSIVIQDLDLVENEVQVTSIVQNYLGNNIYMTKEYYEELFGDYEANGFLINFDSSLEDHKVFDDEFSKEDNVLSALCIQTMKNEFYKQFKLINAVVYLITTMAAGLAFVVLFTLSTTNISERQRELATIKVLGFFDKEVHVYVDKETVILTSIGVILGLPVGRFLAGLLTAALKMPSIYFAVYVYPVSYLYSAGLSLVFALIVNIITDKVLDKIDMVEALKCVE